jgi:hypothetical protein
MHATIPSNHSGQMYTLSDPFVHIFVHQPIRRRVAPHNYERVSDERNRCNQKWIKTPTNLFRSHQIMKQVYLANG